jgi:hypothetical protein
MPAMRALTTLLCVLAASSCHTGSSNTVAGAVIMTSLALGSSAANRAAGGCWAVCQQSERCNENTGLCEALPCRGQCLAGEICEEGFFGVKCLPNATLATSASKMEPAPPPPVEEQTQELQPLPDAAKP